MMSPEGGQSDFLFRPLCQELLDISNPSKIFSTKERYVKLMFAPLVNIFSLKHDSPC